MTIHATLQTRKPRPPWFCTFCIGALWGEVLVAGSATATFAHFAGSSDVVFAATEHLASVSSIVVVASEIGGAIFASASAVDSSAVA
jgi:hypothetical protein